MENLLKQKLKFKNDNIIKKKQLRKSLSVFIIILFINSLYAQGNIDFNAIVKVYSDNEIIYKNNNFPILTLFSVKNEISKTYKCIKSKEYTKPINDINFKVQEKVFFLGHNLEISILKENKPKTTIFGISIFNQKKTMFEFVNPAIVKYIGFHRKKAYTEYYFEIYVNKKKLIIGVYQKTNEGRIKMIQYDNY